MKAQKYGLDLNIHNYKKDKYSAYFEIFIDEHSDGFRYKVNVYDYDTSNIVLKTEALCESSIAAKHCAQSWVFDNSEKFRRN